MPAGEGVTGVWGRTIPRQTAQAGEQVGAAIDLRESAAPVTVEVQQSSSRLKSSPGALITRGNPN